MTETIDEERAKREEAALHEAGHAILALDLCIDVDYVEIYDVKKNCCYGKMKPCTKEPVGKCLGDDLEPKMLDLLIKFGMMHLAGIASQRVLRDSLPMADSGSDWQRAAETAKGFCNSPSEYFACREWLLRRTEERIRHSKSLRKAIEELAQKLLHKEPVDGVRNLGGAEVKKILNHCHLYPENPSK